MTPAVRRLAEAAIALGLTAGEIRSSKDRRAQVGARAGVEQVRREQWKQVLAEVDAANGRAARAHLGSSSCRACGQPLRWVTTEAGKTMSLDPLPRPDGNVVLVPRGKSKALVAQVLPRTSLPVVDRPAYQSHFASCPYADQFRRRRGRRAQQDDGVQVRRPSISDQDCRVCGEPLHVLLVADDVDVHPTCEELATGRPVAVVQPDLDLFTGNEDPR